MFSTHGRYALRIMTDLAQHYSGEEYTSLKDIAERQELSKSYLSNITAQLSKAGLLESKRGPNGGGVRLARPPQEYNIAEILIAAGENIAPVVCLAPGSEECPRTEHCPTRKLWEEYEQASIDFLKSRSLADLADEEDYTPDSAPRLCDTAHRNDD